MPLFRFSHAFLPYVLVKTKEGYEVKHREYASVGHWYEDHAEAKPCPLRLTKKDLEAMGRCPARAKNHQAAEPHMTYLYCDSCTPGRGKRAHDTAYLEKLRILMPRKIKPKQKRWV